MSHAINTALDAVMAMASTIAPLELGSNQPDETADAS